MIIRDAIVVIIIFTTTTLFGQRPPEFNPKEIISDIPPIICPVSDEVSDHYVPRVKKKSPYKNMELDLRPTYNVGFPPEAVTAIEERVFPILRETFSSPVPINISFEWDQRDISILAAAGPGEYAPNPATHARVLNVLYPIALAEKIAMRELNGPDNPDIIVTINQNRSWCFNCDTPEQVGNRFDFVSTILHELYHGLGFTDFANVDDSGLASQTAGTPFSIIYHNFIEFVTGERAILLNDGDPVLARYFQSNQLFFNMPSAGRSKLYAPNPFRSGSSIAHLDEATYNGTSNSLMTPNTNPGEVELSAGIADEMMYDMGWLHTAILHEENELSIENPVEQDFVVTAKIISDVGYVEDSLRLHYTVEGFETDDNIVSFTKVDVDSFQAIIPTTGEARLIDYYIEVTDNRGLRYSNPGVNVTGTQFIFQYAFGPDELDPILTHEPIQSIKAVDRDFSLTANASDEFTGLDTIFVEWQLNGIPQPSVPMVFDTFTIFSNDKFDATITLPGGLTENDVLEYRIVTIDDAAARNTTTSPEEGFYRIDVIPVAPAVNIYTNDFNVSSSDFEGNGFQITQPASFADPAIHTDHPYTAADEIDANFLNFIYELQTPIVLLESGKAKMEFDEIVLVEPGEPNTSFGEEMFWDYVIVEGKRLGGNWQPFIDGYDSGANNLWFNAYNGGIPPGGDVSSRAGDITLFQPRTIDLLENGNFNEGDTVLVRFRLFSDPLAKGWGWAIDNLKIQETSVSVEDFVLEENFELIPNPVSDEVTIALDLESTSDNIVISILDIAGRIIMTERLKTPDLKIRRKYSVSGLSDGIYFVNVAFNNNDIISRKLVVQK